MATCGPEHDWILGYTGTYSYCSQCGVLDAPEVDPYDLEPDEIEGTVF